MPLAALLQILNIAAPIVANVIVAIRNNNGATSAIVYLDAADADFAANQKQVSDWLAAHGKAVADVKAPTV